MQRPGDIQKRVLIVSHTFPPADGIGGRRWAKFAKYLKRKGVEIEVISAKLPESSSQLWLDDAKEIKQYHYRNKYPAILSKTPSNIFQKLSYRWSLTKAMLKADGTPYDRALYDEKAFLEILEERLTAFNPHALIVSSPPVNLVFYAAKIRSKYPEIQFIADFRDPWLDGDFYGYGNLRTKALEAEKAKENFIVGEYDKIVSPWQLVVDGFKNRYPAKKSKFRLLPHGWDQDDIQIDKKLKPELDLIYGGNLYKGFEPLLAFLFRFSADKRLRIEVYSKSEVPKRLLNSRGDMKVRNAIPVKDFFNRIQQTKNLILLIPEGLKDGFPTKILEFAATGKPIIAVGYAGTLSEQIIQKGLGTFVALDKLETEFEPALKRLSKFKPDLTWIENHRLDKITNELVGILEEKGSIEIGE
ncbi:glycosyltransferase family 4 protein [Cryomorpha ignava]|uniref:Glycosyltransferase family 4 protein n=1 Tax=Cryomorpha ignava TaxID=101383 RepID=A0A7K3WT52_9FLAO|nr:glycosyltransferase family 4 protein [Cryomorpha ignava]NEN24052.1 glycosyltransferase family 4 protein [Cryomorpha ignava]